MRFRVTLILLVLLKDSFIVCLPNGLGLKPPLGFNTWNYFGCNIDEDVILTAADRLVALGLAASGYTYLNLDDCWHTRSRDPDGSLQADPIKFPSGMKALARAVHTKGLRFGIYSDAGLMTCAGFPGSWGHEVQDAAQFASWGVDYLKYDNCFAPLMTSLQYVQLGVGSPWEWGPAVGNSWRTDADIADSWDAVLRALDNGAAGLARYAGPGGWNDPDMLEVGVGNLNWAQQRSHFALWALVKAPLLIGANLATITNSSLAILKAKEVIAINQDELGVAGDIIFKEGPIEIWAAPLVNNERAVVLFNRHIAGGPTLIRVTWSQLGYTPSPQGSGFKAAVRDLYAELDLGVFEDGYEADVAPHDSAVLRITPVRGPTSTASSSFAAAAGLQQAVTSLASTVMGKVPIIGRFLAGLQESPGCIGQCLLMAAEGKSSSSLSSGSALEKVWRGLTAVRPTLATWLCKCEQWHCQRPRVQPQQQVMVPAASSMQQQQQQQQQQQVLVPAASAVHQQQHLQEAAAASAVHQQQHQQEEFEEQVVSWRPWLDAAAVQVQQRKRAEAAALRGQQEAAGFIGGSWCALGFRHWCGIGVVAVVEVGLHD